MDKLDLEQLLLRVQLGDVSVKTATEQIQQFDDLGYAKIDFNRQKRTGFPEVIFGEGKKVEHITAIFQAMMEKSNRVLATRIDGKKAEELRLEIPEATYNEDARTFFWKAEEEPDVTYHGGYIAVICGGTSDYAVAEEAAVTAEAMGCKVKRIYDVGVAGIHRLFHHLDDIKQATAVVAVAGMEGALTSVVAGLVSVPIIGVPTSVGYGANFHGVSALLTMINSCAPGVSVVNIDNGFGAGYNAALIQSLKHTEVYDETTIL